MQIQVYAFVNLKSVEIISFLKASNAKRAGKFESSRKFPWANFHDVFFQLYRANLQHFSLSHVNDYLIRDQADRHFSRLAQFASASDRPIKTRDLILWQSK